MKKKLGMVRISQEELENRLLVDPGFHRIRSVTHSHLRELVELVIEGPDCPESESYEPVPSVNAKDFLKEEVE